MHAESSLETLRESARGIVTSRTSTYRQQLHALALVGEAVLPHPELPGEAAEALASGLVCDLHEGAAPYRPRYVVPDYSLAVAQGSEFLELEPPSDLEDAISFLSILYHHVPSITSYPVSLGDVDALLLPFTDGVGDEELTRVLTRWWRYLDRTLPDAFTHANLGPADNRVARVILRIDRELGQVVPNLTLKWDAETSGDTLLLEACRSITAVNKPHVANDRLVSADFPEGYNVVSCYNTLPIGGGSHTLVRLNLAESGRRHHGSVDAYLVDTLHRHMEPVFEVMRARIRFLVEEAGFYDHSFLAAEGLIDPERFTAMFGIYGLDELVEHLTGGLRYGEDPEANHLADRVVHAIAGAVEAEQMPYCRNGRAVLHAQSGISEDVGVTAGARIRTAREPETVEHVLAVAGHHRRFTGGISDIFALDPTARDNPEALADITRGAFERGLREITFNVAGGDLVRVTGYMVRLSDIEKLRTSGSRIASTVLGAESVENWHLLDRVPRVVSHETDPWTRR